jgi:prevent-host-death family protein
VFVAGLAPVLPAALDLSRWIVGQAYNTGERRMAMGIVNIKEAEADLSRLVDRVNEGEEILIARSGRPVAKLVRVSNEPRKPGYLKGQIQMVEDFDAPLPDDVLQGFLGEGE